MEVTWNDGLNAPFKENVDINPSTGTGNKTVTVTGASNTKLDREAVINVQTNDAKVKKSVTIKQKGERMALHTADGVPFFTADSATINLLPAQAYNKVVFDESILDPANVSGEVNGDVIQEMRSKIRRCLAKKTADGVSICYLDRNNSNFYHNGSTAANLTGTQGDVMVYFPDIYTKYERIDDNKFAYSFALTQVDSNYKKHPSFLLGATQGILVDNKIYSRFGVEPQVGPTWAFMRQYARARGDGYRCIDYDMNNLITWLFYSIYGTRDALSVCGTRDMNANPEMCGVSASIGDRDTTPEAGYVNFLGLEHCWGNLGEPIYDVWVRHSSIEVLDDITGLAARTINLPVSLGYPSKLMAGEDMDVAMLAATANSKTGYCSYQMYAEDSTEPGISNEKVMIRSQGSRSPLNQGIASLIASIWAGNETGSGMRLAYRGNITDMSSNISGFINLPVL